MNAKKISLAVSIAALMGAQGAFAFGPTTVPEVEVWMSGATALEKGVGDLFTDLCLDTKDVYNDNSATPGSLHRAYFCTLGPATVPGMTANKRVLFHKRNAGGSAQGVNPLIANASIAHMLINGTNCAGTSPNYTCTGTGTGVASHISDGGVSDVDPGLFTGANTPAGFAAVKAADLNLLTITPAMGVVFGTPATLELYKALQLAQVAAGLLPATCDDAIIATPTTTTPTYTEECMPSLTKTEIASIHAGKLKDWSKLQYKVGGVLVPLTDYNTASIGDTLVANCRRVNGSGTQADANMFFLNNPCTGGALAPAAGSASDDLFGPIIVENSGSGNVETCLVDNNDGTNLSNNAFLGVKRWAIGVQSTEFNSGRNSTGGVIALKNYRFIKVDGYAPTLANAAAGRYGNWVEPTFQWRKPGQANAPTGDVLAILQKIASDAGKPTILANATTGTNLQFNHPFGQAGLLALATNGFTPSYPWVSTNPVIALTHKAGASLDNCRTPVINDIDGRDTYQTNP